MKNNEIKKNMNIVWKIAYRTKKTIDEYRI